MAARLSPEERERRRKERSRASFSDAAYKHHYNTANGFGSRSEWADAARGQRTGATAIAAERDDDLALLGLEEMPDSEKAIKAAYRAASRTAHPDGGGSEQAFIALGQAYERLLGWVGKLPGGTGPKKRKR